MEASNVVAATLDFKLERWSTDKYYFRWRYPDTGNHLDWSTVQGVKMDVIDSFGVVVLTYAIEDGFTISAEDKSYLHLSLGGESKSLPPGKYSYDVKVTFSAEVAYRPWRGKYTVVNVITK